MDCLDSFKSKLNEMLSLLPGMSHSDQLSAIALWEKSISSVQDEYLLNKQTEPNLFGLEFVGSDGLIATSVTPFEEPCDVDEDRTSSSVQEGIPTTSVETLPVESIEAANGATDDHDIDDTGVAGEYEVCGQEQGETMQQMPDKTAEEVSTEDGITEGEDTTQALLKEVVSGSKDIWTLSGETDHNVVTTESAVEEEAVADDVAMETADDVAMATGGRGGRKARKTRRKKEKRQVVKETKEEKCTCGVCGKALANPSNLRVHLRVHNGVRPYKCSICDKSFSIRPNMRRHEKTHSGEKPWECTQCLKRFTEKKSLKVHFRSHTGEKPFECKQCGKCFTQAGTLQSHMHVHTGWKGHLCDFCGKSFRQKSQLRLHEFRHTNNRRYVCQVCTRSFISKGELDRHNMQHTGERPYLCTLCPKMFTRLTYLKEHMNSHTEQTPFLCPHCSESFQERAVFTKHVKRHQAARNTNRSQQQVELHTISASSEFGSKDPYLLYIGSSQVLGMLSSQLTSDVASSGDAVISVPVLTVKDGNFGDAQQMAAAIAADSLESVLETSERFVFVKAEEKVGQEEGAEQFAMVELLETPS